MPVAPEAERIDAALVTPASKLASAVGRAFFAGVLDVVLEDVVDEDADDGLAAAAELDEPDDGAVGWNVVLPLANPMAAGSLPLPAMVTVSVSLPPVTTSLPTGLSESVTFALL